MQKDIQILILKLYEIQIKNVSICTFIKPAVNVHTLHMGEQKDDNNYVKEKVDSVECSNASL